ncbi:tRNA (adenosine(37)-N6)-threonylcarbamoyltransferase complex transferase subunit TsaD [archaeon]|jgi:N6-L-threonylcarbamoyladenine synthase|nr:tRNA (adenosine(37)-N6)-threonylcarbamoyltransferase complex transferase subunit TsaD [archaeon]
MSIIIGIESTAHTFGVGVVKNGNVLSNVRDGYTTESGGIIPMDAAKHHVEIAEDVWVKALDEAGVSEGEISGIAISQAPGLAPCLIEGMKFAKKKCKELNVGLVCVNHCVAHLEIGRLTGAKDPVLLYASGANTQVIAYSGGKYRVFGETLDIGIGNFIDNFARVIGQGFPGGPKVQELALKGKYVELPYSIKGMDVAFSGMLTKLKQMYEKGFGAEDLSFSLQETAFGMLVEASERALAHTGKKELLLGGGVGCNSRLQEMCKIMCEERGCKFFVPRREFLVDNGGMIAYLGWLMFEKGLVVDVCDLDEVDIDSKERTDMVDVRWK